MTENKRLPAASGAVSQLGLFLFCLVAVLVACFWPSFLPGQVHFSNDGPLGTYKAEWLRLPQAMMGPWDDLNTIGTNGGACPASVTTLVRWPARAPKTAIPLQ